MKKGKYHFTVFSFGTIYNHTVTVTIVEETEKQYTIRIPCAIGKHAPGDTMKVMKKSVKLIGENASTSPQTKQYDYSNAYWNN